MKTPKILLIFVLTLMTCATFAQSYIRTGIKGIRIRNSGEIIQEGRVTGYYLFYNLEKAARGVNNYLLTVLDENLNEINSVTITRANTFSIIEASYNGKLFAVLGYDRRNSMIEVISYDNKLTQVSSFVRKIVGASLQMSFASAAAGNETQQDFLVPVTGEGFLLYSMANGDSYQVEFLTNDLKVRWMESSVGADDFELAFEGFQNKQAIGSLVERRRRRNIEYDLLVNNTADGKRLFKVPVKADNYTVTISDITHDTVAGEFIVFGEYYGEKAKEAKDRSLGFVNLVYDVTGNLKEKRFSSWQDLATATPLNEKGKFEGSNTNILFHSTIRTSDGQVFVVGEQYKQAASASGIALAILAGAAGGSSSQSVVQMNIYNLVIFQFNPDFTINKVHVFEKSKSVLQLPAGIGGAAPKLVSHYARAVGGFDYRFTQLPQDLSTFIVTYVDFDRSQPGGSAFVVGSIVYTPEKTFVTDKFTIKRRSTEFNILKAKPGYILVTEYFRKEKKLESRLEKINF